MPKKWEETYLQRYKDVLAQQRTKQMGVGQQIGRAVTPLAEVAGGYGALLQQYQASQAAAQQDALQRQIQLQQLYAPLASKERIAEMGVGTAKMKEQGAILRQRVDIEAKKQLELLKQKLQPEDVLRAVVTGTQGLLAIDPARRTGGEKEMLKMFSMQLGRYLGYDPKVKEDQRWFQKLLGAFKLPWVKPEEYVEYEKKGTIKPTLQKGKKITMESEMDEFLESLTK